MPTHYYGEDQTSVGFFRIDRGLEMVAQDITELLNQLREVVQKIPPLPPF